MKRSTHCTGIAALTAVAAGLALLPAAASAYPNTGGGFSAGKTTITLAGSLGRALDAAGIRMLPVGPAQAKGKGVALPIGESSIEPRFGTGYIFLRGGLQLRSQSREVSIRRLILNTAKKRLTGVIAGHAMTIAAVDDVKARRTDLGATVKVDTLRLTKKAAPLLAARLGVQGIFRTGRLLGRAFASGPWYTVPVTHGTLTFVFDEGFRAKLESLGVGVTRHPETTPLTSLPWTLGTPGVKGEMGRHFRNGTIGTRSGLKLLQAGGTPDKPREVLWAGIAISFENGFGGEGSDVLLAGGGPIGQIEFGGGSPAFNAKTGTFSGGPVAATLSPYEVGTLNETFAGGKEAFVAGEPLGSVSFTAGVR